ncbi:MAG: hypothetical protein P1U82_23575, partial [Verrucomicrobiales bacterium]|nr:hypothetical protein [Verrucomicrobiales bacterium]
SFSELGKSSRWGEKSASEGVSEWCDAQNDVLSLGYLGVNDQEELYFAMHLIHGELAPAVFQRLVQEVAWRTDLWEANLTGEDRR